MNPRYRPEIDGLRAVAVLPVIFFHAGFEFFSGGFVGVDVFFVISGYLITLIIHEEIGAGNFSVVKFYERRVRRILPALFVTCIVCIPFAWLWMMPTEFRDFAQSLVAVNLFASNILFWHETDYFAPAAELKPLLHTWSLAVEEQFYIFFPLILLIFRKVRTHTLAFLLLIVVCFSLGLSEWASHRQPWANFYLLPTRAWELGAGSLVAILFGQRRLENRVLCEGGSMLGLALVLYSILFYDGTVRFPGLSAAVPVLGTVLIVACARSGDMTGKILSWRPLVWVGLISYSAYLWHQPVFAFARIRSLAPLSDLVLLALSLFSIILAYLSWRFIEQPFRDKNKFNRHKIFSISAIVAIAITAFGIAGHLSGGLPFRVPAGVMELSKWSQDQLRGKRYCFASPNNERWPDDACTHNAQWQTKAAIWGDSHAMALTDSLAKELDTHEVALTEYTYNSCVPAVGYTFLGSNAIYNCPKYNELAFRKLLADENSSIVFLHGRWPLLIESTRFDNGEGGVEHGEQVHAAIMHTGKDAHVGDNASPAAIGELYRDTIGKLLRAGKHVVLIYPVPEAGWDVPKYLAREKMFGFRREEPLSTSFDIFKRRMARTHKELNVKASDPNLLRIRPENVLCDTFVVGRCVVQLDGIPLYFDDDHLSSAGAALLAQNIVEEMNARGWIEE